MNLSLVTHRNLGNRHNSVSQLSRRIAIVVSQYPAQPFATLDFPSALSNFITRFDDSVGKALVISFFVIMPDE